MAAISKVVSTAEFTDEDRDVLMAQKRADGSVLLGAASATTREVASVRLSAEQWSALVDAMADSKPSDPQVQTFGESGLVAVREAPLGVVPASVDLGPGAA